MVGVVFVFIESIGLVFNKYFLMEKRGILKVDGVEGILCSIN